MSSHDPQIPARKIPKVRQACDGCHARKIRCDGTQPCLNCTSTTLQCTYLAVPKKKGPKGKRRVGRDALRKPISQPFTVPKAVSSLTSSPEAPLLSHSEVPGQLPLPENTLFNDETFELIEFRPSVLVTNTIMTACLEAFFVHKYPITPILDRDEILGILPHIHQYPERYALITACLAMIVLSPEIITVPVSAPDLLSTLPSSDFLISETIRAREFSNRVEAPTLTTVHTSFFLFAALFCQGKDNSAWFYIREAMTTLQLLRLHEEVTYDTLMPSYASYARRTFWLLFITERAYALQRHRPLTLQRTIDLPIIPSNHAEATILSGFLDLLSLFQNFDDDFLSVWNQSNTNSLASADSLLRLQAILKSALPHVTERTENQQADLLISRQWLKTMVWQLCVSKGLLSSKSADESMTFQYPVTIARDVVLVSKQLPPRAFEANGVGILEKVFDIGCSLSDVLSLSKATGVGFSDSMQIGPRDYLTELVGLLGTVLGGSSKYLELLATKAHECMGTGVTRSLTNGDDVPRVQEIVDDEGELDGVFQVYPTLQRFSIDSMGSTASLDELQQPMSKVMSPANALDGRIYGPAPPQEHIQEFDFSTPQYINDAFSARSFGMDAQGPLPKVYEINSPEWDEMARGVTTSY